MCVPINPVIKRLCINNRGENIYIQPHHEGLRGKAVLKENNLERFYEAVPKDVILFLDLRQNTLTQGTSFWSKYFC